MGDKLGEESDAAADKLFHSIDVDDSGFITPAEFKALFHHGEHTASTQVNAGPSAKAKAKAEAKAVSEAPKSGPGLLKPITDPKVLDFREKVLSRFKERDDAFKGL